MWWFLCGCLFELLAKFSDENLPIHMNSSEFMMSYLSSHEYIGFTSVNPYMKTLRFSMNSWVFKTIQK